MGKKVNEWGEFKRLYTSLYTKELSKSVKDKSKLRPIVNSMMRKDFESGCFRCIKGKNKSKGTPKKRKSQSTSSHEWIEDAQSKLINNATKEEVFVRNYLDSKSVIFEFQYSFRIEGHFFFSDFYFKDKFAILEIDGGYHKSNIQKEKDSARDKLFRSIGIETFRITNEDATNTHKLDSILKIILSRNDPYVTNEDSCREASLNNRDMDNEFLRIISF